MSFRNRPPAIDAVDLVLRHQLLGPLALRYDKRVTVIAGGPGFGKTTLLAQAIVQNRMVPAGLDVWVSCYAGDADAQVLGAAILEGLDVIAERGLDDPAKAVADAVWSRAPVEVALIFDDFHLVPAGSQGHRLVEDLARMLPDNGHLVLASRTADPMALGRYRVAGELIEIGESDLTFTPDEQTQFAAAHGLDVQCSDLSWPALAQLTAVAGSGSAIDYVWDEVLRSISIERRRAIAQVSNFAEIDDDLVRVVTELDTSAASLLAGLPLVFMSEDSSWRFHDLWRTALTRELGREEHAAALTRGGRWLLDNDRLLAAASAFVQAEDVEGLRRVAKAAVFQPLTRTVVDDARQIHALLPHHLRTGSIGAALSAFALLGSWEMKAISGFEIAAQLARTDGDSEIEARSIWLATQLSGLMHGLPAAPHLQSRTAELADTGLPAAVAMRARHQVYERLMSGDPQGALGGLADFDGFGDRIATMLREQVQMDAGRPEMVAAHGVAGDVEDQTEQREIDLNFALALWMRGDIEPSIALPIGLELLEAVEAQRMPHQSLLTLSMVAGVAVAAGELQVASDCIDRISTLEAKRFGRFAAGYGDIAEAALECTLGDEPAAAVRLTDLVADLPIGAWIPRTYLHAVAATYLLVPETRSAIDALDLGPSLTGSIVAARALGEARLGNGGDLARDLDWRQKGQLRSGLWPPHLVELAVAALSTGECSPAVGEVLTDVPDFARHLRHLTSHRVPVIAAEARRLVAELAIEAPHELAVKAFGRLSICIDARLVDDGLWVRRERVRRLFAYLIEHKTVARRRAAAELWPDLEIGKALTNLRVNLSYLQRALEPHRAAGIDSWFITADDEQLVVHCDRLEVDAWQFDELVKRARLALDRNVPSEALELFTKAVDLYEGDYLASWDDEYWASFERLRYRSQLAQAANRAGELLLARGEPEAAMSLAGKVLRFEPLSEPAHRIQIRAMLGCGDRAGARRAVDGLAVALDEISMRPEPDTEALMERLGVSSGGSGD